MGWYAFCVTLLCLAALYPDDAAILIDSFVLGAKTFLLNLRLFICSYLVYRKLKADLTGTNIQAPPFHFTPIKDRR